MDKTLRLCEDGSHTLYSEKAGECYHSIHGALNESLHIFINAGFKAVLKTLRINHKSSARLMSNCEKDVFKLKNINERCTYHSV